MPSEGSQNFPLAKPQLMNREQAAGLLAHLLAGYANPNLSNAETYSASIVELLQGYPLWAGQAAILKAANSSKRPPARAELFPLLDAEMVTLRYSEQWHRRAAEQAEERRKDRERRRERAPRPPGDDYFTAFEKHGRPIGRGERGTPWERFAGSGKGSAPQRVNAQAILDRILPVKPWPPEDV